MQPHCLALEVAHQTNWLRWGTWRQGNCGNVWHESTSPTSCLRQISFGKGRTQVNRDQFWEVNQAHFVESLKPLFRYNPYTYNNDSHSASSFHNLKELYETEFFHQSQNQYPPGYEANSTTDDPLFCQIGADGAFRETDDLRLGNASPAKNADVILTDQELRDMGSFEPVSGNPDIGCYPFTSGLLKVGVDGRRSYPTRVSEPDLLADQIIVCS